MFGKPLAWDDLAWLRSLTDLPLVLKGICHPDDARRAVDAGADGIYVSTHGGRQANGGLAAIDCLPDVAAAVPDVPVLFDSGRALGLRRGQGAGPGRDARSGSAGPTRTPPRSAAPTASCTCCARSSPRPTC